MSLMITSLLIIANFLFANNEIYHHVNIKFDYDNQLLELFQLDIPIDHYQRNKDNSIDIVLSTSEITILIQNGINFEVIQDDLTNYFINRSQPSVQRDFPLGSMLGNYTLNEAINQMDTLFTLYPEFVSQKDSIGTSIEGRIIWAFKLSDNHIVMLKIFCFNLVASQRIALKILHLLYFANRARILLHFALYKIFVSSTVRIWI